MRPPRSKVTANVRQNPVIGCCASFGRQRYSNPPAKPPHNMEVAIEPNGRPWCATANQVTNTPTASPTQGPATDRRMTPKRDPATDAFRLDAVDYLLKPLDPDQVTVAVNRLLEYLRPFEAG
jgi:CheY-like chemotaxis protein